VPGIFFKFSFPYPSCYPKVSLGTRLVSDHLSALVHLQFRLGF